MIGTPSATEIARLQAQAQTTAASKPTLESTISSVTQVIKNAASILNGSKFIVKATTAKIYAYPAAGASLITTVKSGAILTAKNGNLATEAKNNRGYVCVITSNNMTGWVLYDAVTKAPDLTITALSSSMTSLPAMLVNVKEADIKSLAEKTTSTAFNKNITYREVIIPETMPTTGDVSKLGGSFPATHSQLSLYGNEETANTNRFTMAVYHLTNTGKTTATLFKMTVGPTSYSQNFGNGISPVKTGGGYVLMRTGPELSQMQLQGVLFDTDETDERRTFLTEFYDKYIEDQVNAFHEYFTENRLVFELAGFKYTGVMTSLSLSKAAASLYMYNYSMTMLITSSKALASTK